MSSVSNQPQELTLYYEKRRALCSGLVETAGSTFLLLIAIRYFEAGPNAKALLASATSVGLLLSPFVVFGVERVRLPVAEAAALLMWVGSVGFIAAGLIPWEAAFVCGSFVGVAATSSLIPLITQIYQDNYQPQVRGQLYARTAVIRIFAGVIFGILAGFLLSGRLTYFPLLMLCYGGAMFLAGKSLQRIPSGPLRGAVGFGLRQGFSYVRTDRVFRITLISWFIMGFASYMMRSLRVEYLASAEHGLALAEWQVAALVTVVPNLAQLSISRSWGYFFDWANFFLLRVAVNISFVVGILAFFFSDSATGLVVGAAIYGFANAGGDIAWNLWVTKFAAPDRVAGYMGVHTFLTGVRGFISPLLGFHILGLVNFSTLAWISAGMILFASLLLVRVDQPAAST